MQFSVIVTVGDGDAFLYTAEQAAQQVIAALGGDPTQDTAIVNVQQHSFGQAGYVEETPGPSGQPEDVAKPPEPVEPPTEVIE